MQQLFEHHQDVGSSSRSENYFATVKKELIPKGTTAKRLDKFLLGHCHLIDTSMKKAFASLEDLQPTQRPSRFQEVEDRQHILSIENWKNKARKPIFDDEDPETIDEHISNNIEGMYN